ncbi:MAG: HAD hydrolase-like protein [Oscillospiraceae bacterium]
MRAVCAAPFWHRRTRPRPANLLHRPPLASSFTEFYGFDEQKAILAVEKYRERFRTVGLFENRVFTASNRCLRTCNAGQNLAVATSKPQVFAERILEKYGLRPYFKVVVGSELDGRRTDKAEVIEEACRQLGLGMEKRRDAVMIGDRRHDILGAAACGMPSIGVLFGYAEPGELEAAGAGQIAQSVPQLAALLAGE